MVDVDDDNESGFMRHIDQLGYPVHPSFLDGVSRCVTDVPHPCDRDTNGLESCLGYTVESLLGSGFITPSFLVRATIVMGIHLVTEVPSDSHGHGELYRFVILRTYFFLLCLTGG